MNLIIKKFLSLFQTDPVVRLVISVALLIILLGIASLLPESMKIKFGVGAIVFVALLNFRTVVGWLKEFWG